jgi:hypothetical protein
VTLIFGSLAAHFALREVRKDALPHQQALSIDRYQNPVDRAGLPATVIGGKF